MKMLLKIFKTSLLFSLLIGGLFACKSLDEDPSKTTPSWYDAPKQNNGDYLYGVSMGANLEEATKYALIEAASRLMVTISSNSSLLREESQTSTNEEIRSQIKQNIEKIDFVGFQVSRSKKIGYNFFTEVEISRQPFIMQQKESLEFLEKQVDNLSKNLQNQNIVQKRNNLNKILDLSKEIELKSRILQGLGLDVNLPKKLEEAANFKNQLNLILDDIEIFIDRNSLVEINQIIVNSLNKEKVKVVEAHNLRNKNEITLKIKSSNKTSKIYGSFITKISINFENSIKNHTIASNSIEISGSSVIGEKESYLAAIRNLDDEIQKEGIFKILGLLN